MLIPLLFPCCDCQTAKIPLCPWQGGSSKAHSPLHGHCKSCLKKSFGEVGSLKEKLQLSCPSKGKAAEACRASHPDSAPVKPWLIYACSSSLALNDECVVGQSLLTVRDPR